MGSPEMIFTVAAWAGPPWELKWTRCLGGKCRGAPHPASWGVQVEGGGAEEASEHRSHSRMFVTAPVGSLVPRPENFPPKTAIA